VLRKKKQGENAKDVHKGEKKGRARGKKTQSRPRKRPNEPSNEQQRVKGENRLQTRVWRGRAPITGGRGEVLEEEIKKP